MEQRKRCGERDQSIFTEENPSESEQENIASVSQSRSSDIDGFKPQEQNLPQGCSHDSQ